MSTDSLIFSLYTFEPRIYPWLKPFHIVTIRLQLVKAGYIDLFIWYYYIRWLKKTFDN